MKAIRLINFKGFEDSKWIHLRKVTLLFGLNSSGKTSILNALLMLKQSLQNPALEVPFTLYSEKGVDLGSYKDLVFQHDVKRDIEIQMLMDLDDEFRKAGLTISGKDIVFRLKLGFIKKRETIWFKEFSIEHPNKGTLLHVKRGHLREFFSSDVYQVVPENPQMEWYNFLPIIKDVNLKFHPLTVITEIIRNHLIQYFGKIVHIGPLRSEAKRAYHFSGESPQEVGKQGEEALNLLFLDRTSDRSDLTDNVNKWLERYHYRIKWNTISGIFQLILEDTRSNLAVNIKDVGFGISQVLPIIIQGYLSKPGQTVLVEQPEIHLNAKQQAELGDLFIDMANQSDKVFLIETHSEHLLLRLRRRIAETAVAEAKSSGPVDYAFSTSDLAAHFVENEVAGSTVHLLEINEAGQFGPLPDAFRQFFAYDFIETMAITQALGQLSQIQTEGGE